MKASDLLKSRQSNWSELERLCAHMDLRTSAPTGAAVARLATLYRSACADLALVDAYQLPPATIHYLHQLVGRAHNQLYRSRRWPVQQWYHALFVQVPRQLYSDGCLRLAMVIFWGVFLLSMYMASQSQDFAQKIVGTDLINQMEDMYSRTLTDENADSRNFMANFYILHNITIGFRCFAFGLVLGIGGIFETVENAAILGGVFGHMATVRQWANFYPFVTAHGPFELTAIVLSAAAGMRLGFSVIDTGGRTRGDSLRRAAGRALPVISAGGILFGLAALIEGFLSPMDIPYWIKAAVAIFSTLMLLFYVLVLGYPGEQRAAG